VIAAVIPALDEAPRIARVVRGLPPVVARIVVVDDGSTDGTGAVARAADPRVVVLRHERRRGVGAAIAAGALHARAAGAEVVVVLAGDGQMDVADLPAVLAPVLRGAADYVKGDRLLWPEGALAFPLDRLLGVIGLAALTRLATGAFVRDAQCGYCAFSGRALDALDLAHLWSGYGYPNALLVELHRAGLRVAEVPVRPVYAGAPSKLRVAHVPPIVGMLLRATWARWTAPTPRPPRRAVVAAGQGPRLSAAEP
jgi:glycosyltransferase involved in cell wall biosynthesis